MSSEVKQIYNQSILTNYGNWWTVVMFWIIVMFLISRLDLHYDGTHSLQRIHCWASNVMEHFFEYFIPSIGQIQTASQNGT